jgi:myo-inositol 2-dehydrogenase/D-chiro-inositol 1-dehydrogenase
VAGSLVCYGFYFCFIFVFTHFLARMGALRAQFILNHKHMKLEYVIDVNEEAAKSLAIAVKSKWTVELSEEVLSVCDAVWIASGTNEHLKLIKKAQRKFVVVEKPVSLKMDEIREAFAACPALMVAFQRFFDPEFQTVNICFFFFFFKIFKQKTKQKKLTCQSGCHSFLSANGDHPCPSLSLLASLGSIFHDLLIHDISQAVSLSSSLPICVFAIGSSFDVKLQQSGVFDTAILVVSYADGSQSCHSARRASAMGYDQRAEVITNKGELICANNVRDIQATSCSADKSSSLGSISYTFADRYKVVLVFCLFFKNLNMDFQDCLSKRSRSFCIDDFVWCDCSCF